MLSLTSLKNTLNLSQNTTTKGMFKSIHLTLVKLSTNLVFTVTAAEECFLLTSNSLTKSYNTVLTLNKITLDQSSVKINLVVKSINAACNFYSLTV